MVSCFQPTDKIVYFAGISVNTYLSSRGPLFGPKPMPSAVKLPEYSSSGLSICGNSLVTELTNFNRFAPEFKYFSNLDQH